METMISITGKNGAQYSMTIKELRKMARELVGNQGKLFGITVSFDEKHGHSRLIASYETAPNQQTFATMAI